MRYFAFIIPLFVVVFFSFFVIQVLILLETVVVKFMIVMMFLFLLFYIFVLLEGLIIIVFFIVLILFLGFIVFIYDIFAILFNLIIISGIVLN
ncbi:hypothetical protein K450DRAFT_236910 [Umbelopsis ramanniana AG]|uniref:Uncharacterized protein n=1 Tax=Umbelopsis ramanniana AG TaxID=1314678 RepID=A0AAD5HDN9_UMBRA|nr:uncharacterized protein K450DRAFT_236910 [Umbelopsis ramanniana AG]KAI8580412.1 hypothetical protein K450DRAFT_236910 [Umbelopsis ramanniana AG]